MISNTGPSQGAAAIPIRKPQAKIETNGKKKPEQRVDFVAKV